MSTLECVFHSTQILTWDECPIINELNSRAHLTVHSLGRHGAVPERLKMAKHKAIGLKIWFNIFKLSNWNKSTQKLMPINYTTKSRRKKKRNNFVNNGCVWQLIKISFSFVIKMHGLFLCRTFSTLQLFIRFILFFLLISFAALSREFTVKSGQRANKQASIPIECASALKLRFELISIF